IAEQAGPELFATVERIRRRTIALRRGDPEVGLQPDIERERLRTGIGSLDVARAASVARAFTLYFQLVNLAEERQRIRVLRTRARPGEGRAGGQTPGGERGGRRAGRSTSRWARPSSACRRTSTARASRRCSARSACTRCSPRTRP